MRGRAPETFTLSPVTADWFVGPNFVRRAGLTASDPDSIDGEPDDISTLRTPVGAFELPAEQEFRVWREPGGGTADTAGGLRGPTR